MEQMCRQPGLVHLTFAELDFCNGWFCKSCLLDLGCAGLDYPRLTLLDDVVPGMHCDLRVFFVILLGLPLRAHCPNLLHRLKS